MNCEHVRNVIDAGEIERTPAGAAARAHMAACDVCTEAMAAANLLTARLRSLPQLAAPADMSGIVLARIGQHVSAAAEKPSATRLPARSEPPMWGVVLSLLAGTVVILLAVIQGAVPARRLDWSAFLTSSATLLAGGVTLFIAALFASTRARRIGRAET